MKNIILIGMPGSGKTTIGVTLAKKLNMNFFDIDKLIEENYKVTVAEIFNAKGEAYFRQIEKEVIAGLCLGENTVISTGGGVVLNKENIINFKKNGVIVFINRFIENILNDIDIQSRPLLQNRKENLYLLYNQRISLYKKYSDVEFQNNGDIEETIQNIIEYYKKICKYSKTTCYKNSKMHNIRKQSK